MTRIALILAVANIFCHAGMAARSPDEYILAAYEEGRRSILVDVIDGNVIEVASND